MIINDLLSTLKFFLLMKSINIIIIKIALSVFLVNWERIVLCHIRN